MIKKISLGILGFCLGTVLLGFGANVLIQRLMPSLMGLYEGEILDYGLLFRWDTYGYGAALSALVALLVILFSRPSAGRAKRLMKSKAENFESNLENSRFMTEKERDKNFTPCQFTKLSDSSKDGIPVYACFNKKRKELDVNLASPMHGLVIGATGSGKTTTFINPMIQILARSGAGSSMICTDPKGELFQLHSGLLKERGYRVMVLDLRDPYSSFRWNPLSDLYDRYQLYLKTGEGIFLRTGSAEESGLELLNEPDQYGEEWYEYEGKAWAVRRELLGHIKIARQKIFDEVYEDLNDLISVICPVESQDDPVWEKGARSLIMAVCLAMMEDSEYPELEMTKERFCFYNINKAIGNSDNDYEALRGFFKGRSPVSKAVGLSKQVLSAAESTMASYMSIAFDKLSMFNDEGLCSLTSATDIDPVQFAMEPTALFLKIPDEKDTRHALAAVFILCIYKALIKVAS